MTSEPARLATPGLVRVGSTGPRLLGGAVALLAAGLYTLYGHLQWTALIAPSWDLGIFAQLAKAYSTGSVPIVPIKGAGFNLLGDHFHPLLVILGPLWAAWPSGMALLVLQAVLFGLSAYPLTRLAAERHGLAWGGALGAAYALSWGLQSAVAAQFHEIALAVPLLAFALVAHLEGRQGAAAMWAGGLVFVKEDLGLTVGALGLVLAFQGHRRAGAALAAWGLGWFALATFVILPALNPGGEYYYGHNLAGLASLFTPVEKWRTVLLVVTATGIVGLRSPLALLLLPTLAWRFSGAVPSYWGWHWHYSAVLMPIAFAALLDGVARVRAVATGPRWRRWLPLGVAAAGTLVLGASLPLAWLTNPAAHQRTWRWEPALAVVHAVPPGASVETDLTLMAPLVPRAEVFWVGNQNPPPDMVLRDAYSTAWGASGPPADVAAWASAVHGVPYEVVLDVGGFQLAARSD